jgi:hypothetical protein
MLLVLVAVIGMVGVLAADVTLPMPLRFAASNFPSSAASVVSAVSLFLIGASFLMAQAILRPRPVELLKNVLLAAAFLLWGVVQLMEQNALSKKLGDVVIALYVVDLAWMILSGVNFAGRSGQNGS